MVNVNELRIGNLILFKGIVSRIKSLNENGDFTCDVLGLLMDEDYKTQPIPITPEILGKCGFEKTNYGWELKQIDDINFEISDNYILAVNGDEYELGQELKYLHQLQNLYFSLFDKELGIKI